MIKKQLQADQINALKSHKTSELETIRYILSQIKNKEIEKQGELNDEETIQIIRKIAKKIRQSIEAFEKGNRADLVQQYKTQLEVVGRYLPDEKD